MKISKRMALASGAVALSVLGSTAGLACSASGAAACDQGCDMDNIPVKYSDWMKIVINADQNPTIVLLCIDGTGVMTTSRDQSAAAAQLDPALNAWCKTQVGSKFSQTGNYNDEPQPTAAQLGAS